jgi:integrase
MKTYSRTSPVPQAPRLQPDARSIALPAVREAVAATHPSRSDRSDILISQLLGYLADPVSGWDQKELPCILALLDEARINQHGHKLIKAQVTTGTVSARLTSLRCILRALLPVRPASTLYKQTHSLGRNNMGAMAALDQVGNSGANFAELAASWSDLITALGIRRINLDGAIRGFNLNLISNPEKPLPVSALAIAAGTTSGEVVGKCKAIAEAMAPNTQAVIGMTRTSSSLTGTIHIPNHVGRKSNAAVKREAGAARELRVRRVSIFDMNQSSWPQWEELDPTIQAWVLTYRPELMSEQIWSLLRPAYLRLISLAKPVSSTRALNISSNLMGYLKWRASQRPMGLQGDLLELDQVGGRAEIDVWIASMHKVSTHSKASRRSDVRGVLNALYPENVPVRLARQPSTGPYVATEIIQMRALAKFQPTTIKSMQLSALIALCAGAGLTPSEAVHISPSDLVALELGERKKTYLVQVGGEKARAVPLLLEYVELLEEVISMHRDLKYKATRNFLPAAPTSTAHRVIAATEGEGNNQIDIQAYRLRATWLVTLMQAPVPLDQLLHAAGLISARILFDLVSYCQPIDPARIQEILATASSKQVAA